MDLRISRPQRQLLVLMALWVVAVTTIQPFGVGPLDDDWAYAWSVQQLNNTGRFVLSDWSATNLLPQVLWGGLFTQLLGFSFDALRMSCLAAGLGGIVVTWGLLRQLHAPGPIALTGAAVVAFNPVYLALSLRFMSDIPSYVLWAASIWAFCRTIQRASGTNFALACALSSLAILNRQSSIVILAAYSATELLVPKVKKINLIRASAAMLVGLLTYQSISIWLGSQDQIPTMYGHQINLLIQTIRHDPQKLVTNLLVNFTQTGIFQLGAILLPFSLLCTFQYNHSLSPCFGRRYTKQRRLIATVLTAVIVGLATISIRTDGFLPGNGQIWNLTNIGPLSFVMPMSSWTIYRIVRIVLTFVSVTGVLLWVPFLINIIHDIARSIRARSLLTGTPIQKEHLFLATSASLYYIPILLLSPASIFDRYLIPLLPILMAILVINARKNSQSEQDFAFSSRTGNTRQALAAGLILLSACYSVAINHDYMALYRARDSAMDRLITKVDPRLVDAGWELRGWHNGGNRISSCNPAFKAKPEHKSATWGDFTCVFEVPQNIDYKLGTELQSGYEAIDQVAVQRWLPPARYSLYILRRMDPKSG